MAKRKDLKSDKFIDTVGSIIKFIIKEREKALWVGIGILTAIVIIIILTSQSRSENPEASLMYLEGMSLFSAGRIDQAENIFTTIISKYPNTRPGRQSIYYLGYIYYLTKRFNEAKDQFERYLSKEKKSYLLVPSALIGLGSTREGLKDYEGALAAYEKIIEEHSNSPFLLQAKLFAGRIKAQLGDYEGAKRYLEEVIKDKNAGALSEQAKFYLGYYGPR